MAPKISFYEKNMWQKWGVQKKNETTISKSQLFLLILLPFLKINP